MSTDRTDLRPMPMPARDVRPGLVRTDGNDQGTVTAREDAPDGRTDRVLLRISHWHAFLVDDVVHVLGEDVQGSELAAGDVVRYADGWLALGPQAAVDAHIFSNAETWTRAYVAPDWERAQAEQA